MVDPFTLIKNFVSGVFRKNLLIIIIFAVILAGSAWFISQAITKIAPDVIKAINATTELVETVNVAIEKVANVQEGFQAVLVRIDGMSETIARIERIINRIPDRLLRDEVTGEWDTTWMYGEPDTTICSITPYHIYIEDQELRRAVLDILQRRVEEQVVPVPAPQPTPVIPQRPGVFRR